MLKPHWFVGVLLLSSAPAFAFHVPEHVQITMRAVYELQKCGRLPPQWTNDWLETVVRANESEDHNLIRKWSKYSHYYNPYHQADQGRADSSLSVTESVAEINADPADVEGVNKLLGRIIHHVQDSSVPGHAIPVVHAENDGFETYKLDESLYDKPLSLSDCPAVEAVEAVEPMQALHDNAVATIESLDASVLVVREGFERTLAWRGSFWSLGEGKAFGEYGSMGNHFGKEKFAIEDGRTVEIDKEEYEHFKAARVRAAIRATESVILWVNKARSL